MKKKILFVQNLLLLSAALSLAIFTTSCDREEDNPVTVTPSVDGNGDGTGTGNDGGGGTGGGEFVEGTLTFTVNGVDFVMKPVRGGTFWMGAQKDDPDGQNYDADARYRESPVHQVTLSSYYMGETEVTQALWYAVMGQRPTTDGYQWESDCYGTGQWDSICGIGDNYPAYYISCFDIRDFLTALNAVTASQRGNKTFAMPTEAQWEFAARGGNLSHGYKYAGSNTVGDVAWHDGNAYYVGSSHPDYGTHVVKTKSPNELGLYNMSGNVSEWCADRYDDYHPNAVSDPTGPESGDGRVLRGGSWSGGAGGCRVSSRGRGNSNYCHSSIGFRLVLLP